jgi:hypothetical protein
MSGSVVSGGGVGNHPTDRNWAALSSNNLEIYDSLLIANRRKLFIRICA